MSSRKTLRAYSSWCHMRYRCRVDLNYYNNSISYPSEWEDFNTFFRDMGERPEGTTLERKDNDESYSKDNCISATSKQQARNRSNNIVITIDDTTLTIIEWAEKLGVPYYLIQSRISRGWPLQEAVLTPKKERIHD